MSYFLKLLISYCFFTTIFTQSVHASEEWLKENDSCIKSIAKHNTPIEERLRYANDRSDPDILLMYLHTYENTPNRDALNKLAEVTFKRSQDNPECLFNFSLICHRLGLRRLGQNSGQQAVTQSNNFWNLAAMSLEFKKKKLGNLSIQAAKRSITLLLEAKVHNHAGQSIGQILARAQHYDLASRAYVYGLKYESHWLTIFEIYQQLKKIGKDAEANVAFSKALQIVQEEVAQYGTGWFLYITRECLKGGYFDDAKKAASKAIEHEKSPRQLADYIKQLSLLEFTELRQIASQKLRVLFQQNPSRYDFEKMCQGLLEVGETDLAIQMCNVVLPTYDSLQFFPELLNLITLLYKYKQKDLMVGVLRRALDLCQPEDILCTYLSNLFFINSTTCALMTSKVSQDCDQPSLAREAADYAIKCALAQTYDTTEELMKMLEDLESKFRLLHFQDLSQKVIYYKSEISTPAIPPMPKRSPNPFEIYWTDLEGTKGCEIFKRRPCIIITSPSFYNNRKIVTVVPLSTQPRGGTSSVPVYLKTEKEEDRFQEARLDQARSVDVSRLVDFFGNLPTIYQFQLKLAFKNYVGA